MKSFVITIKNHKESENSAQRTILSGRKFGIDIENFEAITPNNNPEKIAKYHNISLDGFKEKWSRYDRCLSAFISHYMLWKKCLLIKDNVLILEHDAVIVNNIPIVTFKGLLSIAAPSYGKFNQPLLIGVNQLTSKPYLPGAHGYIVNQYGAQQLVDMASICARPTDIYINIQTFPWIQEYYPWSVEAHDSFTTIQNNNGCQAKHNFNSDYKIL